MKIDPIHTSHLFDQLEANAVNTAVVMASYYNKLLQEGMCLEHALQLTLCYQAAIMSMAKNTPGEADD